MQTGTISFCDNHALNIKSNTIKTNILELLEKEYGIKILSKHYDKFDGEKTISKLRQNPYLVSLKSNGNPYFMYCTKYNNVNMTMLIDKKIQHGYFLPRIIIVRKGFDSSIYSNTLFEGEMIKTSDKEWVYVVNDILVYKKNRLTSMNILKRLNLINDILENMYKRYPQDIFHIQIKKYVKCSELESKLLLMRDGLNYTNRGLLFKPMFTKFRDILLNFDDSLATDLGSCSLLTASLQTRGLTNNAKGTFFFIRIHYVHVSRGVPCRTRPFLKGLTLTLTGAGGLVP